MLSTSRGLGRDGRAPTSRLSSAEEQAPASPSWPLPATADLVLTGLTADPEVWHLLVGIVGVATGLVLLLVEACPQEARVLRTRFDGGYAEYAVDAVAQLAAKALASLVGVREAKARQRGRGGRVAVAARLDVADGHDPHDVAVAAAARLRERFERGFGLEVRDVRLSVRPPRTGRATDPRPLPDAPPTQAAEAMLLP